MSVQSAIAAGRAFSADEMHAYLVAVSVNPDAMSRMLFGRGYDEVAKQFPGATLGSCKAIAHGEALRNVVSPSSALTIMYSAVNQAVKLAAEPLTDAYARKCIDETLCSLEDDYADPSMFIKKLSANGSWWIAANEYSHYLQARAVPFYASKLYTGDRAVRAVVYQTGANIEKIRGLLLNYLGVPADALSGNSAAENALNSTLAIGYDDGLIDESGRQFLLDSIPGLPSFSAT